MHGLILAPGEPSGGEPTLPAPFREVGGKPLLAHQLAALAPVCDAVTVVIGRGFVDTDTDPAIPLPPTDVEIRVRQRGLQDPPPEVDETRVRTHIRTDEAVDLTAVVLPHWAEVGTADACRQGLRTCRDDTMILDGDVLPRGEVVARIAAEYRRRIEESGRSVMGIIPDGDSDVLSVDWNVNGRVTTFGEDAAHGVAGLHLLHRNHLADLTGLLDQHPTESYPLFLPAVDATFLPVPEDGHVRLDGNTGTGAATSALERWEGGTAPEAGQLR